MATVTAIRERTQSRVAMNKVIAYVCQDKKTLYQQDDRQIKLISGKDCCAETAYSEFMAAKRQYDKASGVFFSMCRASSRAKTPHRSEFIK